MSTAIELHDLIWENTGLSDEWLLQVSGDREVVSDLIRILNGLQEAIKASGCARKELFSDALP